jgi:hypothetical protein
LLDISDILTIANNVPPHGGVAEVYWSNFAMRLLFFVAPFLFQGGRFLFFINHLAFMYLLTMNVMLIYYPTANCLFFFFL